MTLFLLFCVSERCVVPSLHYATTSPAAGTVINEGNTVSIYCNPGYKIGKDLLDFSNDVCNSTTNSLKDCQRMFSSCVLP